MLLGYPVEATAENWLHDCIMKMLTEIHKGLETGREIPTWPNAIPEKYREILRSRTGLRDKLKTYRNVIETLTKAQRKKLLDSIIKQNQISDLCKCTKNCDSLEELPKDSHESICDLFDYAFYLLTDIGVRDRHYRAIYEALDGHICPFCGFEHFDAPGAPREDLDHYLAKSLYPFAAANLRNLVPMGMKCNERYKKAIDILWDDNGNRRRAFDPYTHKGVFLSFVKSEPFKGSDGKTPKWQIDFVPNGPECATWDEVFCLRERVIRDVLNPDFTSWLAGFKAWAKSANLRMDDDSSVIQGIDRYTGYLTDLGYSDRAFLKAEVFRMLHERCRSGDTRLLAFMRDLVA